MFNEIAWLTGMPRSGTTWISQILASNPDIRMKFCPLFSYEFKNRLNEDSTKDNWNKLFHDVYHTSGDFLDQQHLRKDGLVPSFDIKNSSPTILGIKSTRFHNLTQSILKKVENIKFIGLVRNPCASIYSWLSNPLEFPDDADPLTEWRSGTCRKQMPGEFWGFDDWKYVTNLFLSFEELYPNKFRIFRYEDFVDDCFSQTKLMFDWIGTDFNQQTNEFLISSQSKHNDHRRSVYKQTKNINAWKNKLDRNIYNKIIQEISDTPLSRFL